MPQDKSVDNQVEYAGFGLRFLAHWVDLLIVFPVGLIIQSMLGENPFALFQAQSLSEIQKIQGSSTGLLGTVVSLLFGLAYLLIFWVRYDGATPGKKLLGIKIVKEDGSKLSYGEAFIRYIGYFISAASIFLFGLGYLWILWDKKKQAWHDKIAGTVVVKTGQQPKTAIAVILTLFAIILLIGYMGAAMAKGFQLGLKEARQNKGSVSSSILQEKLQENQQKDQDKILSFAPSSCGLTIPVPKTTDVKEGKARKWLFEEVPLDPSNFYVLDKDIYTTKEVQGSFIGYKDVSARLGGESFSVGFPGLNIYCVDNTKSFTLDEYVSLALANKNYKVTTQKKSYWGEVELIPIILEGKDESGKEFKDFAYLGVTKDLGKLLYIRLWGVEDKDPNKMTINEDLDILVRNLRYRGSNNSSSDNTDSNVNTNVKGARTTLEKVKSKHL